MRTFLLFAYCIVNQFVYSQIPYKTSYHKPEKTSHNQKNYKSAFDNLRSDTIDIINYNIFLDFTASPTLSGSSTIVFEALQSTNQLNLDLLQMTVDSVIHPSNGPLNFSYNDTLLRTFLPTTISVGQQETITVYYHGSPQQDPSGFGGFYFQGNYSYNLGVGFSGDPHNYGRAWHPCFDNFAERATYTYNILTPNNLTAYCNGVRVSETLTGNGLLTHWQMDDAIPSYLASVAVAPYTHATIDYVSPFTTDTTPVWLIAEPVDTANMIASFTNITGAIQAYEQRYGPHQWNKVGFVLVPFNGGAMEHATNIAYPKVTANGSLTFETLMAHELAHHWWGDWVTCKTEEDMWINEGMASYSERIFLEQVYDRTRYMDEMRDNHHQVLHLAHILDEGYYALNSVPHEFTYGEHAYNKGSDVAHTMRGYMGDSLFFSGLQSVLNTFGGGNLSSIDFRDHLNTLPNVDVSDFFESWILNPGFSNFSVSTVSISGNGPYTVDVVVDQKLKATNLHHNNVPLTLNFKDESWQTHTAEIIMSGDFNTFSFQIPFEPTFVGINLNERINDAVTATNTTILNTGLIDLPYANTRLTVSNVTDSAWVRAEHHWIYPDAQYGIPAGVKLSNERYWNFHGINQTAFDATMRFEYNGQNNNSGYYDNALLIDYGSEIFTEDSIVLLYRPDDVSAWIIHPDYSIQFQGSSTDKKGVAITNIYMPGQYTWGYKANALNLEETTKKHFKLYPNPAKDLINLQLDTISEAPYIIVIRQIDGKLVKFETLTHQNTIDVSLLSNGTYTVTVSQDNQVIGTQQLVIQR